MTIILNTHPEGCDCNANAEKQDTSIPFKELFELHQSEWMNEQEWRNIVKTIEDKVLRG